MTVPGTQFSAKRTSPHLVRFLFPSLTESHRRNIIFKKENKSEQLKEVYNMDPMFKPVETKRAYDVVFEQIENMILSGELKPGDKLPSERELMTIYNRSHPTIREALRMLESSNYIRVIPGGCAEVCYSGTESIQDSITELLQFRQVAMQDIYQFVRMAEPQFISQILQHITWEDFVDLEALCDEMLSCMADPMLYSSKMFFFHVELMKATHNPLLFVFWNCMGEFWSKENLTKHQGQIGIQNLTELQESHRLLIQAVKAKDSMQAKDLVRSCWQNWQFISQEKEGA